MKALAPLILTLMISACTTANMGQGASENQTQSIAVQASYGEAFRAAAQVAAEMRWRIDHSDRDAGIITASYPQTLGRWGDDVTVTVLERGQGARITVRSSLGQGPNHRYVQDYLNRIRERLQ